MSDNVAEVKAILSHPRMGLTARPHNIPSRQVRPCGTALAAVPVPYCFTFMQRTQMTSDICTQEKTQFSGCFALWASKLGGRRKKEAKV